MKMDKHRSSHVVHLITCSPKLRALLQWLAQINKFYHIAIIFFLLEFPDQDKPLSFHFYACLFEDFPLNTIFEFFPFFPGSTRWNPVIGPVCSIVLYEQNFLIANSNSSTTDLS